MNKSKLTELLRYAWLEGRTNGFQNNGKSFSEFLELKEVSEALLIFIKTSNDMKDEIEQIVSKVESGHLEAKKAVDKLLVLFGVVESWVCPMDNEPPLNTLVLAKDPNGNIQLTSWRKSYGVFSCQGKSEGVYGWVWKNI